MMHPQAYLLQSYKISDTLKDKLLESYDSHGSMKQLFDEALDMESIKRGAGRRVLHASSQVPWRG